MAFTGSAFEYPNACAISAGSVPPNKMEKKLRKAQRDSIQDDSSRLILAGRAGASLPFYPREPNRRKRPCR